MDLFGINKRRNIHIQAMVDKQIQAMIEGERRDVILESLLTGTVISGDIKGIANVYKTYESQVDAIYKKYNNNDDYGCAQTRALIDMRTAFIAGQGLSISCNDKKTSDWIENYIQKNRLNGIKLLRIVKSAEMSGHTLLYNDPKTIIERNFVNLLKFPYYKTYPNNYLPTLVNRDINNIKLYNKKTVGEKTLLVKQGSVYMPFGGDDMLTHGPTPKLGNILINLENYDRASKDMRRLNYVLARITPTVECKDKNEVNSALSFMDQRKWKIGDSFVSTAKFKYETPSTSAHDMLIKEMVSELKVISANTGIPVHWLGYVDLMSNRATADSLYEFINNATLSERLILAESFYELIVLAQEVYINNGGEDIKKINYDFEVKIPLIDYANFLERVKGWSMAFADGAISMADYRNELPGIDPMKTKRAIEEERKAEEKELMKTNKVLLEKAKAEANLPGASGKNNIEESIDE